MYYVMRILNLLNNYRVIVLSALFFALLLFALVNWLQNPYRKQNKKLRACTKGIRAYPAKTAFYAASLPEDYRRQWRAFVNCGTDKPALVFEFVPKHRRVLALWLLIGTSIVTSAYVAVFAVVSANFAYIVMQVVFWLAFGIILFVDNVVARRQIRKAKQVFAQFVAQLTTNTPKKPATIVEDTVNALNRLNKTEVTDATVGKASEILHSKGLTEERTVEEQRRINVALNGLLQSYAKNAQHKPA